MASKNQTTTKFSWRKRQNTGNIYQQNKSTMHSILSSLQTTTTKKREKRYLSFYALQVLYNRFHLYNMTTFSNKLNRLCFIFNTKTSLYLFFFNIHIHNFINNFDGFSNFFFWLHKSEKKHNISTLVILLQFYFVYEKKSINK